MLSLHVCVCSGPAAVVRLSLLDWIRLVEHASRGIILPRRDFPSSCHFLCIRVSFWSPGSVSHSMLTHILTLRSSLLGSSACIVVLCVLSGVSWAFCRAFLMLYDTLTDWHVFLSTELVYKCFKPFFFKVWILKLGKLAVKACPHLGSHYIMMS